MISGTEWILAGGVLLPVGHWVYLQTQKRRIVGQIQKTDTPVKGYEISLLTPYGSELFLKSKYSLGNYRSSDLQIAKTLAKSDSSSLKIGDTLMSTCSQTRTDTVEVNRILQNCRSSMFDVPTNTTFRKYTAVETLSSFKVQKREYPKGVFYHPQTQQLASCSQQLLKDIQYLKMGPSLVVAGICVGITGYSWLSYHMNEFCEKPYFSTF